MSKILSEKKTVELMIHLYCRKKHGCKELCATCKFIKEYAFMRLEKCPFGDEKPACKACKVHCYQSQQREKIREIMRYSGPRMVLFYPTEYIRHKINELKKKRL